MNTLQNNAKRHQYSGVDDPFKQLLERFFRVDDSQSDGSSVVTSQWTPRVDIREDADRFVLFADLPGVDPQAVEILMDKGILTVRGERTIDASTTNSRYSRLERRHGNFHRRFALPDSADPERITAHGANGVLEIAIPKRPETTPRRIRVGVTTEGASESSTRQ